MIWVKVSHMPNWLTDFMFRYSSVCTALILSKLWNTTGDHHSGVVEISRVQHSCSSHGKKISVSVHNHICSISPLGGLETRELFIQAVKEVRTLWKSPKDCNIKSALPTQVMMLVESLEGPSEVMQPDLILNQVDHHILLGVRMLYKWL